MARKQELEQRKDERENALRDLVAMQAKVQKTIGDLERRASASLAGVAVAELDAEAKRQATARVELDAAQLAAAELGRRIDAEHQALERIGSDLLAVERDDVALAGAQLVAEIEADAAALRAKLAKLAELDKQHRSLDGRIQKVSGYCGAPIRYADKMAELAVSITTVQEALRVARAFEAEVKARAAQPKPERKNKGPMSSIPAALAKVGVVVGGAVTNNV